MLEGDGAINQHGRFRCASTSLSPRSLLARMREALWMGLALSVALHAALTQLRGWSGQQVASRPLTTHFIKRQPRLTKPLELRKRPQPKRRPIQRTMLSVQAKLRRQRSVSGVGAVQMVRSLARAGVHVPRPVRFTAATSEPGALAQAIHGSREAASQVDMSLEMMDIEALDTGKYHAMVIQDPRDKRNIRGFFHLAVAYSETLYRTEHHSDRARWSNAILRLADAMNRCTAVKCKVTDHITWTSQTLLQTPWVYTAVRFSFRITATEALQLGKYLVAGGFLMTDAQTADRERARNALRNMVTDALASQGLTVGTHYNFDILPDSYPLYHCFFEFDGPPMGSDFLAATREVGRRLTPHPYLRAVCLDGQLRVLESDKNYRNCWSDWGPDGLYGGYEHLDPTRAFQFGVNILIFALTQEGSITSRAMDTIQ